MASTVSSNTITLTPPTSESSSFQCSRHSLRRSVERQLQTAPCLFHTCTDKHIQSTGHWMLDDMYPDILIIDCTVSQVYVALTKTTKVINLISTTGWTINLEPCSSLIYMSIGLHSSCHLLSTTWWWTLALFHCCLATNLAFHPGYSSLHSTKMETGQHWRE